MSQEHVHISKGVTKLGSIPSVSLPPCQTCRPDAPCVRKCYARKGRFAFSRNKALLEKNFALWSTDPERYEQEVFCAAYPARFFRWHSSGDIPCAAYLEMMVRVAQRAPDTKFLVFTKKFELVNAYLDSCGAFPANLCVVLSAWGAWLPENPHGLPVAYIRFRKDPQPVPEHAFACRGFCGECVLSGHDCWSLQRGEAVVFDEH